MEKTTVHDNLHTEVMENVIYIQMLGGFSMTYHGQPVLLGKSLSSKMLHLLMLLIYSRGEGIRRIRLLEQLYGDSDTEQAADCRRIAGWRVYLHKGRRIYVDSGSRRCGAGRRSVPETGHGSIGGKGPGQSGGASGGGLRPLQGRVPAADDR